MRVRLGIGCHNCVTEIDERGFKNGGRGLHQNWRTETARTRSRLQTKVAVPDTQQQADGEDQNRVKDSSHGIVAGAISRSLHSVASGRQ
jgi:hypothetical protein